MTQGARTPRELETLLEDAFLWSDAHAVAGLFEEDGLLLAGSPGARPALVLQAASVLCGQNFRYLSDILAIWQRGDTAVVLGAQAFHVAHRGRDGAWRYLISYLGEAS